MGHFDEALEQAEQHTLTRSIPATTYGQIAFLLDQARIADKRAIRGTDLKPASRAELARRVGEQIGVTQRTVERYRDKTIKAATGRHAADLTATVRQSWQPRVRAEARKRAATSTGIAIEVKGTFGFDAPGGTTDSDRVRTITKHMPASYAERLFDAQEAGASDDDLQEIVREAMEQVYFRDNGRRAQGLNVNFTNVHYVEIDYR